MRDGAKMGPFPHRNVFFRIFDVAGYGADHGLQVLGSAGAKETAFVAVGVEIEDGVFFQVVDMSLNPFDRAEESGLFTIPSTVDDGALRRPSLLVQFAEHASFFEFRRHAGDGIVGAVHPCVVMVAANHPLAGGRTRNGGDDVIDGFRVPVGGDLEVDAGRAGPDVIGEGQAAAPSFRGDLSLKSREERLRVGVGDGQDRNVGDRLGVFEGESLRPWRCADTGC